MSVRLLPTLLASLAWVAALAAPVAGLDAHHVLVVANADRPESVDLADAYARARSIPTEQVLRLRVGASGDEIGRADYQRLVEAPLARWFDRAGAHDRILCIVLVKGLPLRIAGSGGRAGTLASVDSELALLYRKMTGRPVPPAGPLPNPYFLGDAPIESARPFSHEAHDSFLVARLDGFTAADVQRLIASGVAAGPAPAGRVVLDTRAEPGPANDWLRAAAERLASMGLRGDRVVLDAGPGVVRGEREVIGYASWGSTDPEHRRRSPDLAFVPGAVATWFVGTDGRTFTPPPEGWTVGTWSDRASFYAGSPESLAGDLVAAGVTGVAAHVAEPYLDGSVRPQILLPAYLAGFSLAEAFHLALPHLSWRTLVVGDPLATVATRPGPRPVAPSLDARTDTGPFFTARWLQAARERLSGGARLSDEALRLALRAQMRVARGDLADACTSLERATSLEPGLLEAQFALASVYEAAGDYPRAEARYRLVLAAHPDDPIALNNLAFLLAAHLARVEDALPIAQRAYALARGSPHVADTLGWVHFLGGNLALARQFVDEALQAGPDVAEIRVHAAAIAFAGGDHARAREELAAALRLDEALAERADVVDLRQKLAGGRTP